MSVAESKQLVRDMRTAILALSDTDNDRCLTVDDERGVELLVTLVMHLRGAKYHVALSAVRQACSNLRDPERF